MSVPVRAAIQRLPEEVVGKIAAGEVVESPAAALKELVENSIDAGATAVTVETREGGITFFRVTDNGSGIAAEDLRMAFERHATSKLRTAEDLFDVRSLGFRGEALASIAAVAKVTLTTRTPRDDRGTQAVNVGGVLQSIQDAPSPEGTTIVVQELFFNTPARLKFLKKPSAEGARVADMVMRMLLSRPDIAFRLIQNDKQVYQSPGDGKLRSAVYSAYGRETTALLRDVCGTAGGITIEGLVGVGPAARANRTHQSFFLNGRYVRSALLTQAVEAACRERVVTGQFPVCVLHLRLPAALVDVNVHPNKLEVRFSDEPLVLEAVRTVVQDALSQDALESAPRIAWQGGDAPRAAVTVRTADGQAARPFGAPEASAAASLPGTQADAVPPAPEPPQTVPNFTEVVQGFFSALPPPIVRVREGGHAAGQTAPALAGYHQPAQADAGQEEAPLAPYRVLGVAFQTYILLEQGDLLLLIDQHAAHERILYERMMAALAAGEGSQQLLVPQVVGVSPMDRERLDTYADAVRGAGFDVEPFGEDAVQLRAVPLVLGEPEAKASFLALVDQLGDLRVLGTQQKRREAILQMACKKAIKGGDALAPAEIEALLLEMCRTNAPPTCPHGRPLVVVLARSELEKRFKRIV